jgi:hypothetical protein
MNPVNKYTFSQPPTLQAPAASTPDPLGEARVTFLRNSHLVMSEEWNHFAQLSDEDKKWLRTQLNRKDVQKILDCIEKRDREELGCGWDKYDGAFTAESQSLMHVLYTLLGLKPVTAIEKEFIHAAGIQLLEEIVKQNLALRLIDGPNYYHFINEKPLSAFDPRHYLAGLDEKSAYEIGHTYSLQFSKIIPAKQFQQAFSEVSQSKLKRLVIQQMADGIVLRTPYFRYSYALKNALFDLCTAYFQEKKEREEKLSSTGFDQTI